MSDNTLMWPVYNAIQSGNTAEALRLFESDTQLIRLATPFGSWLHVASGVGNLELVKYLVTNGVDINQNSGIVGGAPISEAAAKGHLDVVNYLIQAGAVLDTSKSEFNPLFSAIYGGHIEVVRSLLAHGIDSKTKYTGTRMKNMDAEGFARERGQLEIAQLLASHG